MAVYKVIQDIEAEDKLLGPLSLKGFVYAAITGTLIFISIRLAISSVPTLLKTVLIIAFTPPAILFGVLASPLGREQPTEVWLLSRIKFLIKNHKRRWDQSGMKDMVKITVPKKPARVYAKDISQEEVSSRLQALANTLDSRGWAIKNTALNLTRQTVIEAVDESDERLATATSLNVNQQPIVDIQAADDILDETNNPSAQKMKTLVNEAEEERKLQMKIKLEEARERAQQAAEASAKQPSQAGSRSANQPGSGLSAEEQALLSKIHQEKSELALHPPKIIKGSMRAETNALTITPAKLELSNSGELSVATISKLANSNVVAGVV